MKNKKGFTLVEILAVIAIIAILGVAATAGVSTILQKQRQNLAYQAEESIAEASLTYFGNKGVNYVKACTNSVGDYVTINPKDVENINKYLRETKFNGLNGTELYNELKSFTTTANSDPNMKEELSPYIKVNNHSCYKLVTVGELIEQGLVTDADGMCNRASVVLIYRKTDAKNTAGIMTNVQETGICKSTRKSESGPVVTISPRSSLTLSPSKAITVTVTTESTKLKPKFTMYYGWSKSKITKPTTWSELSFSGNTETKASADISVSTIDETRYLWIKKGTPLDNKNNKTSEMISGPYAFLNSVIVHYDCSTCNPNTCSAKKTVVFTSTYNKTTSNTIEDLCEAKKTCYDFDGWYRDGTKKIENDTKVDIKIDHTLVPKWSPHKYKITLDKNLATNSPTASIKATYSTNTLTPANITVPVRSYTVSGFDTASTRKSNGASVTSTATLTSNYIFNGWTTTKDGSVFLLSNVSTPVLQPNVSGYTDAAGKWIKCADTTAYANWTSRAVTLPTISKTGYECGWTTSPSGTTITYNPGTSYTPTADTTMYGVCKACNYTVAFDKNSTIATGTTANTSCTYDNDCVLTSNGFSLSGYKFNGWNTAANGTGTKYGNSATVKNLTSTCNGTFNLYARWCQDCASVSNGTCTLNADTPGTCTYTTNCNDGYYLSAGSGTRSPTCSGCAYTIKFDKNDNSATGSTADASCTYGVDCTLTKNGFSLKDYTFNGWNTKSDGKGTKYTNSATVKNLTTTCKGTVTLYARWCRSCVQPSNGSCTLNADTPGTCTYTTKCNSGYTISNNGKYNPSCTIKKYTITYNANGGSGAPDKQYKTHGKDLKLSTKQPTRSNYTFKGWGVSQSDTTADYAAGATYKTDADITLYAIWAKTITVTFKAGKAGWMSDSSLSCTMYNAAKSCNISSPNLTNIPDKNGGKTNYSNIIKKVGWNTSKNAVTSTWNAGTSKAVSSNATYYAIFKVDPKNKKLTVSYTIENGNDAGLNFRESPDDLTSHYFTLMSGGTFKTHSEGGWKYYSDRSVWSKLWLELTQHSGTCSYDTNGICNNGKTVGWASAYYLSGY